MDRAAIVTCLRGALQGAPLRLAILFGSAARGRLRVDSDLDLAILPRDPAWPLAAELRLEADLSRACGREVQIVRIDRADTLLSWQIARHGVLVTADPPTEYPGFAMRAAAEYLDAEPALLAAGRLYARRLAGAAP
ncbi:MAG TPA: nucleotidyltransferase domain-containing protein [Polyangia bacterium]|jgi:predicted nucleotidyltransferase